MPRLQYQFARSGNNHDDMPLTHSKMALAAGFIRRSLISLRHRAHGEQDGQRADHR
jgi:hypothetical protein